MIWWRLFVSGIIIKIIEANLINDEPEPIVNTLVGSIQGRRAQDGNYSMFMGIPYAEVNKSNVFGPAIPYPKFKSTFNAYDDSVKCPQKDEFNSTVTGSLDCLQLNVYVPHNANITNRLPVFVWIYGGRFRLGFAGRYVYGPSYLVRHDIILVTFNYRVGPYGFMCLDIPEVPGNQGLKDQLMALRWVKKNIAAFGGDDAKITLGGNSVGAACVDYHVHFRMEQLFSKVILQSGNVAGAYALIEPNPTAPFRLANELNYTTNDLDKALRFLGTMKTNDVIGAVERLGLSFEPCVEKPMNNVDNYVTDHPINVAPKLKDIDVLIGFNNKELDNYFQFSPEMRKEANNFARIMINDYFNFTGNDKLFQEVKEILTRFYFNGTNDISYLERQMGTIVGDFDFCHATLRAVKKYLTSGVKKVYLYLFSYSGGRNFNTHIKKLNCTGALHADDIGYLFDISYMKKPLDSKDKAIVVKMTKMWTNFIKYGNPTPMPTEMVPVLWPRLTENNWQYLELNSELRVSSRPFRSRMAFLDLLFLMNRQYRKGYKEKQGRSSAENLVMDASLPLVFTNVVVLVFLYFVK